MSDRLSAEKMAKFLGNVVAVRTIQSICSQAHISSKGGGYPISEACSALLSHFKSASEKVSDGKAEASRRRETAEASSAEMDLAVKQKELLPRSVFEEAYADAIAKGSAAIVRLPGLSKAQKEAVFACLRNVEFPKIQVEEES